MADDAQRAVKIGFQGIQARLVGRFFQRARNANPCIVDQYVDPSFQAAEFPDCRPHGVFVPDIELKERHCLPPGVIRGFPGGSIDPVPPVCQVVGRGFSNSRRGSGNQYDGAMLHALKIRINIRHLPEKGGRDPWEQGIKKRQATYIAPLRPHTLAAFPPWGIQQELVV